MGEAKYSDNYCSLDFPSNPDNVNFMQVGFCSSFLVRAASPVLPYTPARAKCQGVEGTVC